MTTDPLARRDALVAVVVVNWNGLADTRECLSSLVAQTWSPLEIHVVDNASQNAEAAALEREFGARIRLWRSATNLGFAGGCNLALTAILAEARADAVALLNNDAVAEPGWVAELMRATAADQRYGTCASRMVFYDHPEIVENTGIVILSNGDAVPRGRGQPQQDWLAPAPVIGACAGAALYRTAMLREIGLFRDDFFANFEDVDLALRARALGWHCAYAPHALVRHRLNRSIAKVRNEPFDVRSIRNLTWAYAVNMPWQAIALNLPWLLFCNLFVVAVAPLFGQLRVSRVVVKGRLAAWRERAGIRAERRRLAPRRKGSWLQIWRLQRSFAGSYLRFFWEGVLLRRRRFMT